MWPIELAIELTCAQEGRGRRRRCRRLGWSCLLQQPVRRARDGQRARPPPDAAHGGSRLLLLLLLLNIYVTQSMSHYCGCRHGWIALKTQLATRAAETRARGVARVLVFIRYGCRGRRECSKWTLTRCTSFSLVGWHEREWGAIDGGGAQKRFGGHE